MTDTLTPEKREEIRKRYETAEQVNLGRAEDPKDFSVIDSALADIPALLSALDAAEARLSEALEALGLMLREHDILSGNFGDVMDPKHRRPDRWPTAAEAARRVLEGGRSDE